MKRLIEIYSRLNAIDDLLSLMLHKPDICRELAIGAHVGLLVEYVDHVSAVMWRQWQRGSLSDFDACNILPAISDISLQVKQRLTVNSMPLPELAGYIAGLISLVSFYIADIEAKNGENRVLH